MHTIVTPRGTNVEAAERLLAQAKLKSPPTNGEISWLLVPREVLEHSLAPVIGTAGVHALWLRSVSLTRAKFPALGDSASLSAPVASREQRAKQLEECLRRIPSGEVTQVATTLYATFFELLSQFIGERLVRQVVPDANLPSLKEPT